MANVERIDSVYDIAKITGEHEQLQKLLEQDTTAITTMYNTLETFQGKSNVTTVAQNWENVTAAMTDASGASQQLAAMQNQLNAQITKYAELEKQMADVIAASTKAKKSNKDLTDQEIKTNYEASQAQKNRVKDIISETDAYKQLERERDKAAQSAKTLLAQANRSGNPADFEAATKAANEAKGLTNQLKRIDDAVGESRRKVGDYTGAVRIMEEELAKVNEQLSQMESRGAKGVQDFTQRNPVGFDPNRNKPGFTNTIGASGQPVAVLNSEAQAYAQLKTQAQQLNQVVSQQGRGFSSVTQQIRQSERALATMAAEGLEGTEAFERLRASTIDAAQAQKEFMRQEKLLESAAPVLEAVTLAAKGLAGAYAVGAGSVALFADGNEKVEKELNKLVAIMTILQGLQETYELINKSGAAAIAIRTALTKAANAVIGEKVVVTEAAAAADTELAVAETEVAAVSPEVVAGAEAETAAMGEMAAATDVAAASAVSLETALVATGIGAAIVAVAVAIAYLLSKIPKWIEGNTITTKQQGEIADAMKKANQAIIEQAETVANLDDTTKKYYENQLALSSAAGQNEYKQFAIKKQITAQEKQLAQDQIDLLGATNKQQSELKGTIDDLNNKRREAIRIQQSVINIPEQNRTSDQTRQLDAATAVEELYSKQIDAITGLYEAGAKARADLFAANQKEGQEELAMAKFQADEQRKLILETGKLEVDATKDKNAKILSDQRSTFAQRMAAIQSNRNAEIEAAGLDRNSLDPNSTTAQVAEANAKFNAARAQAQRDYEEKSRDEMRKEYERNRDAQEEVFKAERNDRLANAEAILKDERSTNEQRQQANYESYEANREITGAEMMKELDQLGLNEEQRKAIIAKYNDQFLKQDLEYNQTKLQEQQREHAKQLQELENFFKRQKDLLTTQQVGEHVDLNNQYLGGGMGSRIFAEAKQRLQEQQAIQQAQIEVTKAEAEKIGLGHNANANQIADADAKAAEAQMKLSDAVTAHEIGNRKRIEDKITEVAELSEKAANEAQAIVDENYERQIRNIERTEKRLDTYYNVQDKRIADSSLQQNEKAAAQAVLDRQEATQKAALQKQERRVKVREARFDRDAAVASAIENGVVATIKALGEGGPIYAAVVAALVAAQIAEIVSKPLPTYGFGTKDHIGGLAMVGDRYEPELIHEPGKRPYLSPSIPTVVDLAKHATVTPLSELRKMQSDNMFIDGRGILIMDRRAHADSRIVAKAIGEQTERLEKAIQRQRRTTVVNNRINTKWGEYVERNVYR